MNEYDIKQAGTHLHCWQPWGSEIDENWQAIGRWVHAHCGGYVKGKACKATRSFTAAQWHEYRSSLSRFQDGGGEAAGAYPAQAS